MLEEEKDEIYEGIYLGAITVFNLPVGMYENTASKLQSSLYKGYGKRLSTSTPLTQEWLLLNDLRENVNIFSGAKTFQQIKDSQSLILDSSGVIRPFNDYLTDVKKLDAVFNDTWLKTERDTAVTQAQNIRQWQEFEKDKDIFPLLVYHTQKDERVRASHAALEGFTAPVNDPYWSSIAPQNSWKCRCWLEQKESGNRSTKEWEINRTKEYNKKVKPEERIKSIRDVPEKEFKFNPAKSRMIFKTEGVGSHPYMKVGEAFESYKADNFNLDINFGL